MKAFVAVVEAASFTEAARRLDTSKSVISRRITDLESALGTSLLDRGRRNIRSTEVGAVYYAKCVRILESIQAANDFATGFNGKVQGSLRVVLPKSLHDALVVPLLCRFAEKYPEVTLQLESVKGSCLEEVHFDVAIWVGSVMSSDYVARDLASFRYVMCASPAYLRRRGVPSAPRDLPGHDGLFDCNAEHVGAWEFQSESHWQPYEVRERMSSDKGQNLLDAAMAGIGIAMLPEPLVANAVADKSLRVLLPEYLTPTNHLSLIYPKNRRSSQKVQRLISFLSEADFSGLWTSEAAVSA
ncbi:LysR family transcriptional regulator [Lysobacter capsici]|uniref:LysR family transcriptional regulator n=1 Tax=Lysobacter capsici TaxID=435897 RepID=UPI000ACBB466|nr:LysR family transcriptional regulator [Lysobacter capsici]